MLEKPRLRPPCESAGSSQNGMTGGGSDSVVFVRRLSTDRDEHRRQVEARATEVLGLILPDWQAVIERDYHSWDRDHVTIDTAGRSIAACIELVLAAL